MVEAPASITIITSDDIKKFGYRNLPDILRSVRGLFVNYDRNYNYVGFRGFSRPGDYDTRILILIDGHRLNEPIYDSPGTGGDFILDVDLIDRVEVIRGPSSSLYGSSAFMGIINVKTKRGKDIEGVEVSGAGGRFSTYNGRLSYGNKFENGLELLVSGSGFGSDGDRRLFYQEFNDPTTNNGIAKNKDGEQGQSFFGSLSYKGFSLAAGYVNREKDVPTGSFETVFNAHSSTTDRKGFADLKYEHEFAGNLGLKARTYYDNYYYKGLADYDYGLANLVRNKDFGWANTVGTELQITKTLFDKHKVIFGGEFQYVLRQDQKNYDIEVYLDERNSSRNWAIYLQDEYEILKGLRLTAGVRFDHFSLSDNSAVSPRVGLVYLPFDKTVIKLLYGHAFRAPNAFELFYQVPSNFLPSNGLGPERTRTVELLVQQYLGFNLWGAANLYYQKSKDIITQIVEPVSGLPMFQNAGEVAQKGVEFELEGKWQNGVRGRMSYAVQRTEDVDTKLRLTNSPVHLAKFNGVVPLMADKLFLGLEEQYTSGRKTLAGNQIGGFWVTNVTLFNQRLFKGLDLSASIYNLFGKKYSDPGSGEHEQDAIRQDGRSFRFKLTFRY
ncbi:MAG: TonB-dependent receptor [Deltaproteobacteria bacterium]|nr:TonB-dependent receptor [Deltaproteobacteria bacterium]